MKRFINILLIVLGISFVIIVTSGIIHFECLFKSLFDISCPGCGLTRAFRAMLNLDFYSAFNYNILSIPLFILIVSICIGVIIDIIRNDDRTIQYILKFFKKYYVIIIILLIVSMIVNNIRGI